jgi:glycosyltransferase involved in cell wall biosynthesis
MFTSIMTPTQSPFVSVIIPVCNDVERLKICLQALDRQTYPQHLYETIVIDNSLEQALHIVGVVYRFKHAIFTFENTPGSYAARNQGISIAKGSIIAFTDADCIPSETWIEQGVKNLLQSPNCGFVAGKIKIFFKDADRLTAVELYEYLTALPQQDFLTKYHFGATANLFTFRAVIDKVGMFNSNLKSSGDLEWGQRVYDLGYQQIYAVDVCVAHPARHSFRQLYLRTIRIAGGQHDLINQTASSYLNRNLLFLHSLMRDLIPPVMFIFKIWRDDRLIGTEQKIKVSIAIVFVRYISAWEKLRLKFGGISARY